MVEKLFAGLMPHRWAHVKRVASRAAALKPILGGDTLEIAAWFHDVGYAPQLVQTGFHPLDGSRHLEAIKAPSQIVGLVAFHSAAASEAQVLGLASELMEFEDERTVIRDLLWYLDMTTSPVGTVVGFTERMAELHDRYPPDHYVIRALELGMPERVGAVQRAEVWLASVGLIGQV